MYTDSQGLTCQDLLLLKNIFNLVCSFTVCVLSAYFKVSLIPTYLQLSLSYVIDANIHSSAVSKVIRVGDQSSHACEATTSGIPCI
jgi:hypothetical protein